jgi:NTP pyrophosphatase (non-canonical NTP hydrolase)
MMNFGDYQVLARRTSKFKVGESLRENVLMAALGLSGEVGELNDRIKKMFYHQHPTSRADIEDELGDILWYLSEMCSALSFNLQVIAYRNIEKLEKRYPDGFDSERSINRGE